MLRDRKTIVMSVIIPIAFNLLLMFFMTNFMFNDSVDEVNIAVSDHDSMYITEWLEDLEGSVVTFSQNPRDLLLEGDVHVALLFDSNFDEALEAGQSPAIQLHFDPASMNSSGASEQISVLFSEKMYEIVSTNLIELNVENHVIEPFYTVPVALDEDSDQGALMMLTIFAQLIIVLSVQLGGFSPAADIIAGEKERKTMEALLMSPVNRLHLIVGKWLTLGSLCSMSGFFSVITFTLYVYFAGGEFAQAMQIENNLGTLLLSLTVGIVSFAFIMASLFIMISLVSNTVKESGNYLSPLTFLTMIPYFLLIGTSVNEFTIYHFIIPVFNIFALIKELIYGVYNLTHILLVAGSSAIFISILFAIAYRMFMNSKFVLGK